MSRIVWPRVRLARHHPVQWVASQNPRTPKSSSPPAHSDSATSTAISSPEAEEQFKQLVASPPKDPFGYANLGLTYLQGGSLPDAEKQLSRARDLDPASADVGRMLARSSTR